jgi:hypothetical protein
MVQIRLGDFYKGPAPFSVPLFLARREAAVYSGTVRNRQKHRRIP